MSDNKYLVLARKYRPLTFDDLVGQDALVKTVSNAIKTGRVPHAYLLTGIRGIGKTTSARIIARTLNCIGEDGKGGIPFTPCGKCSHCKAIIEDRDIDVIEIDAASNTGVDNIRELIEGAKYSPVSARFKIYIIDEVHMLSKAAFNALLKTLEEPPEHVKFILATTEVRKIPVTILSRCQRFDLKRLSVELMAKHLFNLAEKEGVKITPEALNILSLLSEGSARDGVSLLDQAISFSGKEITEEDVKKMTGIADKSETCTLFYEIMAGNVKNALENINVQYENGTEPDIILNDLLELTHIVTKIKSGGVIETALMTSDFATKAKEFAKTLNMASLTLVWQMMVKGGGEISLSPFPFKSLEMLIIRICYATAIPDFRELLKKNSSIEANVTAKQQSVSMPDVVSPYVSLPSQNKSEAEKKSGFDLIKSSFDIYHLAEKNKEARLAYNIKTYLRPVGIENGKIKIAGNNEKSEELTGILLKKLVEWTGEKWEIEVVQDNLNKGETVRERHEFGLDFMKKECLDNEIVKEILDSFDCIGISKIDVLKKGSGDEEYSADQNDEELYLMSQTAMMQIDDY